MKKTVTMLAMSLAGATLASGAAKAQTRGGFEAGLEIFDYSYRERVEGETIVYDDGILGGIHLGFVQKIGSGMFLRAKVSGSTGSVDYRSPDPAGDERIENVSQSIGQVELHFGIDVPVGGGATVSPFAGLAARVLSDESGGKVSSGGLLGYDREIGYSYVPIGLGARVPAGKSAVLFNAQYNHVVDGAARSNFSDTDPEAPNLKLDLDGGHGFEASVAYEMPVGKHALSFGPFVRHWKIDSSDRFTITNPDDPTEALELYEPRNSTTQLGLRVSFAF